MNGVELYELIQSKRKVRLFDSKITPATANMLSSYIDNREIAESLVKGNLLDINFDEIPILSDFVKTFITKLVSGRVISKVLDPWMNLGEILRLINSLHPSAKLFGYTQDKRLLKINKKLNKGFTSKFGSCVDLLISDRNVYDLVISNLPVALMSPVKKHGLARNDIALQIIVECIDRLHDSGVMLTMVGPSFFYSSNAEKFREIIIKKGYHISAIYGTPTKSVNQNSSLPFYLLVIKKGPQGSIFQADIDEDEAKQLRILDNYASRTTSGNISEGIWVAPEEIKPIHAIILHKELERLLRQTGLPLVGINALGTFVSTKDINNDCIVIPKNPFKKIFIASNDHDVDGYWNFIFRVNTDTVDPFFLVEFLNSDLGNKILNHKAQGAIAPLLNGKNVREIFIPIPSVEKQKAVISVDRIIRNTQEIFTKFHSNLWTNPNEYKKIEKNIRLALKDPNGLEWVEDLPFPIASILWGYHSESRVGKKVEYLFLFFEALCEFLDAIIVSALSSNKAYFNHSVKGWIKNRKSDWHVKSSFGGWRYLFESLAKNIRAVYSSKAERDFIIDLFGQPDDSYIALITSKNLVNVFSEVNQLRNDYKGHGGLTSEEGEAILFEKLDSKLYAIKEELVAGFSSVNLLNPMPNAMDWDSDLQVFNSTCKLLKGSRSKFHQCTIQTNKQVSSKKIYLLNKNRFTPVELLPLVQIREAPKSKQSACFFYNRIDKDKVRFVSYHFDIEAEMYDDMASIGNALEFINPMS